LGAEDACEGPAAALRLEAAWGALGGVGLGAEGVCEGAGVCSRTAMRLEAVLGAVVVAEDAALRLRASSGGGEEIFHS